MKNYALHLGDCLDYQDSEQFSLIYLDPPYSCKGEDKYYGVGETFFDYLSYMYERLKHLRSLMLPDSNIVVHVDHKASGNIRVMMDSIFGRENFKNEIIWCFSSPSIAQRHLPRKHNNLFWYGFGNYPFNPERIPYKTKMNVGGKTAWSKEKIPWEHYESKGKLLEDWWTDIPALCRNEGEKTGWATQKPIKLMRRVVGLWSNEGQRVLDPFMGSGSFVQAAAHMGRYAVGVDRNEKALEIAERRLDGEEDDLFEEAEDQEDSASGGCTPDDGRNADEDSA